MRRKGTEKNLKLPNKKRHKKKQSNVDERLEKKYFLLGLNIRSLRYQCDDFILELEKIWQKLKNIAVKETLLRKSDTKPINQRKTRRANLKKDHSTGNYHPLLPIPRYIGRERGGLFSVDTNL